MSVCPFGIMNRLPQRRQSAVKIKVCMGGGITRTSRAIPPLCAASKPMGIAWHVEEMRIPQPVLHPYRSTPDRHHAGARNLDQADRNHERDEAFDLLAGTGDLEHEAFRSCIDDARPKCIRQPQRLDAVIALAAYLD